MGHVPLAVARKIYLKVFVAGSLGIIIAIFAVFSIYWGALWKIPAHNLQGWIVVRASLSFINTFALILPSKISRTLTMASSANKLRRN